MPETTLIWKRPDGFHGASPEDYRTFELDNGTRLWLHRTDQENYPFRVSGGWQDEISTKRINTLVNLLGVDHSNWKKTLEPDFEQSGHENLNNYLNDTITWVQELQSKLKCDTWEQEILGSAINEVCQTLDTLKS